MRKLFPMLAVAALFAGVSFAAEDKTITGKPECAKCTLKEDGVKTCTNVVVATEDGKQVKYYMDPANAVAKENHGKAGFCQGNKDKVKVTGAVEKKDGKMVITPSKIEVVEG